MIFGELPLSRAEGALLAHKLQVGRRVFKKGRRLSASDVAALAAAGIESVVAARLESGDLDEDSAAAGLAGLLAGSGLRTSKAATGRCNLIAEGHGLLVFERDWIDRLNRLDEAITIATLPPFAEVRAGQTVATVKIIPLAVAAAHLETAAGLLGRAPPLRLAPFRPKRAALLLTRIPAGRESLLDKAADALKHRLEAAGAGLVAERRCAHRRDEVAAELSHLLESDCDLVVVCGASASIDRGDVVPAGIIAAGGAVERFGMPADPGNLLVLARHGARPIVGMPGCARSLKLNGFDWVLQRLLAELPLSNEDITAMGVGGLLEEMPGRPMPREQGELAELPAARGEEARIGAVVLAAGRSTRMGAANKLLEPLAGEALVRRVAAAAAASRAAPVILVTGHQSEAVRAALEGLEVTAVENPHYRRGLGASIACGLAALPDAVEGAVILLGDMPLVTSAHIDQLIAAFDPAASRAICVAAFQGRRGNPVLFARHFFAEMAALEGDVGAKHLLGEHAALVHEVEMADAAVLVDVDTPEMLAALAAETPPSA